MTLIGRARTRAGRENSALGSESSAGDGQASRAHAYYAQPGHHSDAVACLVGSRPVCRRRLQAYNWSAGLFVFARFLDHFDGELARQKGTTSRFGYHFDYFTGASSYAAFFLCMGLGLSHGPLGGWATILGLAASACAVIALFLNLGRDRPLDSADLATRLDIPHMRDSNLKTAFTSWHRLLGLASSCHSS